MQAEMMSFGEWQQYFVDEKCCLLVIINLGWPEGFCCPRCGHQKSLFHNTKLPLVKLFWSLYWVSSDKGSISALRLTKLIGVSWLTVQRLLRKLRSALADQNNRYKLSSIIEFDDAFIGGKRADKHGRGVACKPLF